MILRKPDNLLRYDVQIAALGLAKKHTDDRETTPLSDLEDVPLVSEQSVAPQLRELEMTGKATEVNSVRITPTPASEFNEALRKLNIRSDEEKLDIEKLVLAQKDEQIKREAVAEAAQEAENAGPEFKTRALKADEPEATKISVEIWPRLGKSAFEAERRKMIALLEGGSSALPLARAGSPSFEAEDIGLEYGGDGEEVEETKLDVPIPAEHNVNDDFDEDREELTRRAWKSLRARREMKEEERLESLRRKAEEEEIQRQIEEEMREREEEETQRRVEVEVQRLVEEERRRQKQEQGESSHAFSERVGNHGAESAFTYPDEFGAPPNAFKVSSEENLNTKFSPSDWCGKFEGNPDYFAPSIRGGTSSTGRNI